jgi:hypothetical protein
LLGQIEYEHFIDSEELMSSKPRRIHCSLCDKNLLRNAQRMMTHVVSNGHQLAWKTRCNSSVRLTQV